MNAYDIKDPLRNNLFYCNLKFSLRLRQSSSTYIAHIRLRRPFSPQRKFLHFVTKNYYAVGLNIMSVYDTPFWSPQFYDHKARWIHYFHQIRFVADEIRRRGGDTKSFSVLEVGPSHGLVNSYLKKFGVDAKTVDIKPEYTPDFLGSVFAMPIPDNSFDMVIACEVLEHYPFTDFKKGLAELRRVTKKTVLFSCPDARRILLSASIKTPFLKEIKFALRIPTFQTHTAKHEGDHHWEIGKREYPPSRIRHEIISAGFSVREERVSIDTPKNHYFLLEKKD